MKVKVKVKSLSSVRLFATPWTVAYQAPQSMEFSRQEYWIRLPFPSPEDLPNPGIEPGSPALQAGALPCETREAQKIYNVHICTIYIYIYTYIYIYMHKHKDVYMHIFTLSENF